MEQPCPHTTAVAGPSEGLIRADGLCLAGLLLLATLLHGWLIARTEALARDGTGFIHYALELEKHPWREVIAHAHQHPFYPLTVLVLSWPMRYFLGTTCETMRLSAQLAAALPGILLVVPMFFLGRALFDRRVGFWAAVLFQCLPVTARITADTLSDALCLFLAATALWLGIRALNRASLWRFVGCGLCSGLAYLTRPEGILPGVVVGLVLVGMQAAPRWRRSWRQVLIQATGLVLAVSMVSYPFVAVTGRLSTKPTAQGILQGHEPGTPFPLRVEGRGETSFSSSWFADFRFPRAPVKAATGSPSFLANVWTMVLLTAAQPGPIREGLSLCGSLWIVANVTIRAFHYLAWLPGLLGLWWFRDRLRSQRGAWVLLGLCALFGCALVRMTAVVGYLSERHVQLLILCGSLWAAAAIVHVGDWLAVRSGAGLRRFSWSFSSVSVSRCWLGLCTPIRPVIGRQACGWPLTPRRAMRSSTGTTPQPTMRAVSSGRPPSGLRDRWLMSLWRSPSGHRCRPTYSYGSMK